MGFDYNPFKHIEVLYQDKERPEYRGKEYPIGYYVYCHNCGGEEWIPEDSSLPDLFAVYRRHVEKSHERTDEDFEGWTV